MAKVKGLWNCLMPFATDSTGVCSLFCDADAVVIGMDPGATAVRCYPFTERRKDKRARYKGIQIGEIDALMGKLDESADRIRMLVEDEKAGQVVLVGTPAASLLGVDLKALSRRLEKQSGRRVMGFSTTGNRYYDEGLSDAFRIIYDRIRKEDSSAAVFSEEKNRLPSLPAESGSTVEKDINREQDKMKKVNLLGFDTLDYPDETVRQGILEHIEKQQMRIGSIWGFQSDFAGWEHALEADLNIVCSASAVRLAGKMEKDQNIPFVPLDEYLEQTGGLGITARGLQIAKGAERILIIGEQISSGALRKYIRACCRDRSEKLPEIVHASFFLMHRTLMEEEDRKLGSEEDLITLLSRDSFDLVIGDPMFRLLADPEQEFIMRVHPPVSGSFADQIMSCCQRRNSFEKGKNRIENGVCHTEPDHGHDIVDRL